MGAVVRMHLPWRGVFMCMPVVLIVIMSVMSIGTATTQAHDPALCRNDALRHVGHERQPNRDELCPTINQHLECSQRNSSYSFQTVLWTSLFSV